MSERWLPVPGYESSYEVSDIGRVRSLDRWILDPSGTSYIRPGQMLNPSLIKDSGYYRVSLCSQGSKPQAIKLHRLVLLAFVGPCPELMEVRHLDGIKSNCALYNLQYGTKLENEMDKIRHGTHYQVSRVCCPKNHLLVSPNLVPNHPHRKCLSCARALGRRKSARRVGRADPDMQLLSDEIYVSLGFSLV